MWVVVEPDLQPEVVLLGLQPLAGVDCLKAQESGKPEKGRGVKSLSSFEC